MKHHFAFTYKGTKVLTDNNIGWEGNHLTGILSNTFNSAAVNAFRNSGIAKVEECYSPQGEQAYFDVQFPSLSKTGYHFVRIEVKAAAFGRSANDTTVYGGLGATKGDFQPHEYFIIIHDNNFKSMFVMIATLSNDDWSSKGKNTIMTIGNWWQKHKDMGDYRFLKGKIRGSNKGVQIIFEDTD